MSAAPAAGTAVRRGPTRTTRHPHEEIEIVVEYLTFVVASNELARWLEVEEQIWSRFLEQQAGFVGKQMWVERGDEARVHAVIWWRDMEAWQAVGADAVARVDELMGPWLREAISCRTFDVVRDS